MDKKAITLEQLEEALRDMTRWIKDKLADYIVEPAAEGESGYVLTTNGAGGRSWEYIEGAGEQPDETLTVGGRAADAAAVGEAVDRVQAMAESAKTAAEHAQAAAVAEITTSRLADGAVTGAKLGGGAVTRSKLAADALYSPIVTLSGGALTASHVGKTVKNGWNAETTYTMTQANSSAMDVGAEIAIFSNGNNGLRVTVTADGVRFAVSNDGTFKANLSVKISDPFGMIALKKFEANSTNGDMWVITGNVEVVS